MQRTSECRLSSAPRDTRARGGSVTALLRRIVRLHLNSSAAALASPALGCCVNGSRISAILVQSLSLSLAAMPRASSNKRIAADRTDEAPNAKRGKSDAAAADAVSAATDPRAGSATEQLACCVCFEDFAAQPAAAGLPDRTPRALPCGHDLCTACLPGFVSKHGMVKCPDCQQQRQIPLPAGAAAASMPSDSAGWMKLLSHNRNHIALIEARQQQQSAAISTRAVQLCQFAQCKDSAVLFCSDCSGFTDFCGLHDGIIHSQSASHTRGSQAEQAAAADRKFLQLIAPLAAVKREEVRAMLEAKERESAAVDAQLQQMMDTTRQTQAAHAVLQKRKDACQIAIVDLRAKVEGAEKSTDIDLVNQQAADADALPPLIAPAPLLMPDGLLRQLTSEQQQHFKRLLPDVKPVSQRSPARIASRHGCRLLTSFAGVFVLVPTLLRRSCACSTAEARTDSRPPLSGSDVRARQTR